MSKEFAAKPKRFAGAASGFGEKKSFGPKRSFGDRPSYGGDRGGYGSKPAYGTRKSFGGPRPAYGAGGGYGSNEERPSFEAICDGCSKDCRVPFRPNGSKPVLCTNCFRKQRDAEEGGGEAGGSFGARKSFGAPRPAFGSPRPSYGAPRESSGGAAMDTRLKALEAKVDRILKLLGGEEEKA